MSVIKEDALRTSKRAENVRKHFLPRVEMIENIITDSVQQCELEEACSLCRVHWGE